MKERLVEIIAAASFAADERQNAAEGWSPEDSVESTREGVDGRRADPMTVSIGCSVSDRSIRPSEKRICFRQAPAPIASCEGGPLTAIAEGWPVVGEVDSEQSSCLRRGQQLWQARATVAAAIVGVGGSAASRVVAEGEDEEAL
ncbi:hypothetical protein GW17_00058834 [Ensete ventricosum]|nr:hypothetical protein GW17_00058834 [Ensete ventricosum]